MCNKAATSPARVTDARAAIFIFEPKKDRVLSREFEPTGRRFDPREDGIGSASQNRAYSQGTLSPPRPRAEWPSPLQARRPLSRPRQALCPSRHLICWPSSPRCILPRDCSALCSAQRHLHPRPPSPNGTDDGPRDVGFGTPALGPAR
jgi:hypothetical protein